MAIDPNLETIVSAMQSNAGESADGMCKAGQKLWFDFRGETGDKVGKFEYEKLHKLFNRDNANEQYIQGRNKIGTIARNIQTAKMSGDFLAGLERDFRMRHRSRIRMFIHAGTRYDSNSKPIGPLRRNTTEWFNSLNGEEANKA